MMRMSPRCCLWIKGVFYLRIRKTRTLKVKIQQIQQWYKNQWYKN